jgi:hypothetical protein
VKNAKIINLFTWIGFRVVQFRPAILRDNYREYREPSDIEDSGFHQKFGSTGLRPGSAWSGRHSPTMTHHLQPKDRIRLKNILLRYS